MVWNNCKYKANNKIWICELSDAEFISSIKVFIEFGTKSMINFIRDI